MRRLAPATRQWLALALAVLALRVAPAANPPAATQPAATQPATTQPATTQPATTQPAAATTQPVATAEAGDVVRQARRIWQESLAPPKTAVSEQLQRTMDELRRISVSPRPRRALPTTAPSAGPVGGRAAATQPAATQPAAAPGQRPGAAEARPSPIAATLPKKVVERLKGLSSSELARPCEVADTLYRGGYLAAAYALYENVLKESPDAAAKGWALYQMANCLRLADGTAAAGLYGRVVSEHADSPWAALAAAERNVLRWQQANKPMDLLKRIRSMLPGASSSATTRPATTRPATTQPATTRPATAVAAANPPEPLTTATSAAENEPDG